MWICTFTIHHIMNTLVTIQGKWSFTLLSSNIEQGKVTRPFYSIKGIHCFIEYRPSRLVRCLENDSRKKEPCTKANVNIKIPASTPRHKQTTEICACAHFIEISSTSFTSGSEYSSNFGPKHSSQQQIKIPYEVYGWVDKLEIDMTYQMLISTNKVVPTLQSDHMTADEVKMTTKLKER